MEETLLKDIAFSDTGFIFNPITGESYSVNPIGVCILNRLREGKSLHQICEHLVADFEVEHETAERDLMEFMNILKHFQLASTDDKTKD
jgi:hypothetical protein